MKKPTRKTNGETSTPAKVARKSARVKLAGTVEREPFATAGAALNLWAINRRKIEERLAALRHGPGNSILLSVIGGAQ